MNNIQKKNKLYSISHETELPNKKTSDVTVKANQIIYTSVNNNFEKLIDNDLFIEKQLQNAYQYQIGPKPYDKDKIKNRENGYKYWNKDIDKNVELSILHKVETDLNDTITKSNINKKINCILDNGQEILIGTSNGLYRRSSNGIDWTTEKSGLLSECEIYSSCFDEILMVYYFATNNGIYQVDYIPENGNITNISLKSDVKDINKIYIYHDNLYIYGINGLSSTNILDENISFKSEFTFTKVKQSSSEFVPDDVVSVNQLSGDTFITSKNGVFSNKSIYSFDNIETVDFGNDIKINFLINFSDNIYFATNKGLYKYDTSSDTKYSKIGDTNSTVYNYCIYENTLYLLIGAKIFKLLQNSSDLVVIPKDGITKSNGTDIYCFRDESIGVYDDILFVTYQDKIYWKKLNDIHTNDDWNSIYSGNTNNPSQLSLNSLMISGKNGDTYNITEILIRNENTDILEKNKEFGLRKIVYSNGYKFFLTKNGLYKNSLTTPIINGDIKDMTTESSFWCVLTDEYIYIGKDINNINDRNTFENSYNVNCCKICNGDIFFSSQNKILLHKNYFYSTQDTLDLKEIDIDFNIRQIEVFNYEILILEEESGNLYKIHDKTVIELEENKFIPYDDTETISGYTYSFSSIDVKSKCFYGSNGGLYTYNNNYGAQETDKIDRNYIREISSNGIDVPKNISYISEYYYYYDSISSEDPIYLNEKLTNKKYTVDAYYYSFTKNVIEVYTEDDKLHLYSYYNDVDEETGDVKYKFEKIGSYDNSEKGEMRGLYHIYDMYTNTDYLSGVYILMIGKDYITYGNIDFDEDKKTIWGNITEENYKDGKPATVTEYELTDIKITFNEIDVDDRLKNVKFVTNVEDLTVNNMLIFVNGDEDINMFIQDDGYGLIDSLEKGTNILKINTDFIDNGETIQSITAHSNDLGEYYGVEINLYIKTNNYIYSCRLYYEDIINAIIHGDEVFNIKIYNKKIISNEAKSKNFEIEILNGEMVTTSETPMSFNRVLEQSERGITITDENGITKLKTDTETRQLYKFKDDKVILINQNGTIKERVIADIKNISFTDNKYAFITTNGLYTSENFDGELTEVTLVKGKELTDTDLDNYGSENEIWNIINFEYGLPFISNTTTTLENHLNLKYNNNGEITFINQNNEFKILNTDLVSSFKTFLTDANKTVTVLRETDRFIIDTNGQIYNKMSRQQVIDNNLNGLILNDDVEYPIVQDEQGKIIISNKDKNKFYKFNNVDTYSFFRNILTYHNDNFIDTYVYDDEKMIIISDSYLYYFFPYENIFYIKYYGNGIKNIKPYVNDYIIHEGNKLFLLNNRFNVNSKKQILSKENIKDFERISEHSILLGCEDGLYETHYEYTVINDIPLCTATDLNNQIKDFFDIGLTEHIQHYHNEYTPITKINDTLMPVDCSNINGMEINSDIDDFIETVEIGDQVQYISALIYFNNELSINNGPIEETYYIAKNYGKKNICELNIFLPTTKTTYINHSSEIKNDVNTISKLHRKNTGIDTSLSVNDNKTNIDLLIDKNHFEINRIIAAEINGNSLPLSIYTDTDNKKLFKFDGFSQVIKKSKFKYMEYEELNDVIHIHFMCYGTDAQAIRLISQKNIYYYVRYHKISGEIVEVRYIVDIEYDVPYNYELQNGKLFKGWSIYEDDKEPQYEYTTKFKNISNKKNDIIDLYPVYQDYVFDTNDSTIFTLKPTRNMLYINGDIIVDKQVVIDYDIVVEPIITIKSDGAPITISSVETNDENPIVIDWDYKEI